MQAREYSLSDTMLNFVENLLENEGDPRSGPMNDQDHSLSLSDLDRTLVLSHFRTNYSTKFSIVSNKLSKVILFFTRRKICRTSEASVQIRRVKKRNLTNELHTKKFSRP
jgi:hypothetical protein